MSGNPDLENCALCAHIDVCKRNEKGTCTYAHSLARLQPPKEVSRAYNGMWIDGVDRWYGQQMKTKQLQRIEAYYYSTSSEELPVWAVGLQWFYSGHVSPLASVGT